MKEEGAPREDPELPYSLRNGYSKYLTTVLFFNKMKYIVTNDRTRLRDKIIQCKASTQIHFS